MKNSEITIIYSGYNSTLEGATVTIWYTDMPSQAEEITSICLRNTTAVYSNNGTWELVFDPRERCSVLSASGKIILLLDIVLLASY